MTYNTYFNIKHSLANLAACARRFLALGAFGSARRDLDVSSSLLDTVETLLRLVTILVLTSVSLVTPAIVRPLSMKSSYAWLNVLADCAI